MSSADTLNYALAAGALALVAGFLYLIYYMVEILKSFKVIMQDTEEVAGDILRLKNGIRSGFSSLVEGFFKIQPKRG